MKSIPDFLQLDKYNISSTDITQLVFRCDPEAIHPDVILMPYWQADVFSLWVDQITTVTKNLLFEINYQGRLISIIRCGIGAPLAGDTVLALGHTDCQRIIFAGSVGGLHPDIHIGDLMIPEFSYCGDGFSRYLQADFPPKDCFLEHSFPDEKLSNEITESVTQLAGARNLALHTGPIFSIDSILAQFSRLDYLANQLGCIGIEMETAAVFKAARLVGIRAAALFSVSDVPVRGQNLFSGRPPEDQVQRKEIRKQVLARAVLDILSRTV